jgi:hypothetical protein
MVHQANVVYGKRKQSNHASVYEAVNLFLIVDRSIVQK